MASKPDLFNVNDYKIFLDRVHQLNANSQPLWGSMTVGQMLAHCREVQDVCNGKTLQKTSFLIKLFKGFIKKSVLSDKPYPKNLQTHQQYIVSDPKDFELEKAAFLKSLDAFVNNTNSIEHSLFGTMSVVERSWAVYKHHNHHLEQFGV